ncbi:MAG TPA: TIGR04282 family arsenosugar biosynthesis glycosyltransferase [Chitinophagales bacterium]|nr:TIGR04282 family arsenosugar biosynthesis glycosyltransferase [Chitinophagales bacterium]
MKQHDSLLMIFVKNPIPGKVKTRLAKTMGEEKALEIYRQLLDHTHKVTQKLAVDKIVFYSDEVITDDIWEESSYDKKVQEGSDLGKRMVNAFKYAFSKGYRKAIIIGSDCFEITPKIITEAFAALPANNFVIGPTHDGGYYLLGMATLYASIFKNKRWSSDEVLHDTLVDIRNINGSYKLLKELTDIDTEADLDSVKNLTS